MSMLSYDINIIININYKYVNIDVLHITIKYGL